MIDDDRNAPKTPLVNTADKTSATPAVLSISKTAASESGENPEALEVEIKVVDTSTNLKDGQNKCPKCGSTHVSLNIEIGRLCCNDCRHQLEPQKFSKTVENVRNLKGVIVGSGATDISASAEDMVTFKCDSCGAEVVVDTAESLQARCHWCRSTLLVNQQIPNGAVPDKVLPFSVKKSSAIDSIA
ncbi:MAG: hypothetical protein FWD01_03780, partial [Defluviitaleaceae bacterium]|nr:hypothetical protein [Defluviitaleaceae bacterium]